LAHSAFIEVITEIAVLISLFGAGLKLAAPVGDRLWWIPFRLATVSMVVTVALTAAVGVFFLELPLGAAVLLGAILAPTDPVLATDVQVKAPGDDDRLRFSLTGEAGLNDGTAFPMVMLGMGLLGLHDLGEHYSRWWLVDVVWACSCGLAVGGALGMLAGWVTHHVAPEGQRNEFIEDFLGLGLIAVAYGLALLLSAYGFLADFAACFMLHRTDTRLGS
jgi:NhaP-type Na+/H+ or K+/H+ antiporter